MNSENFDVAVIGGGPAGCSAAITLASQGAAVILLDAGTYPHHKVCGEFLSPECRDELNQLGMTASLRALHPVAIETARIVAPDGTAWETHFPEPGIGLSRAALDMAMARQAAASGADVREATTVTSIQGSLADGFTILACSRTSSTSVRARTVISAHGKRSTLDRALNRDFLNRPQPFIALKTHVHGPSVPHRVDLFTFRGGYCGMSEVEDGTINICLLVQESVFKEALHDQHQEASSVSKFLRWMQGQNSELGQWLGQAKPVVPDFERWLSIAQVSFAPKQTVVNDVLMAGDSAGLIVPLVGDGIAMALQGGRLAADCTASFMDGRLTQGSLRRVYNARWRDQFAGRLRLGSGLQSLMLRPGLLSIGLKALVAAPALGTWLVNHTRDSRYASASLAD